MFGIKTNGVITFSYDTEQTFDDVSKLSSYMVKNLGEESGSMLDELAISADEREVYDVCLNQALPTIHESMVKLASGISDAFGEVTVSSKEATGLEREAGRYIEFNINDNDSLNENIKALVDESLYTCLKYAILSEFYSVNVNRDLYKVANNKFADSMFNLNKRLFQLKKKSVTFI